MIDEELSKLHDDIPNIDINEGKAGIFKKYESLNKSKKNVSSKRIFTLTLVLSIFILSVVIINNQVGTNTNEGPMYSYSNEDQIGSYYIKDSNISIESSLVQNDIVDNICFSYSSQQVKLDELYELHLIDEEQKNRMEKLENNTNLNKGYEILSKDTKEIVFSYKYYLAKKNGQDVIILVDNNSNDEVVVYHSFQSNFSYKNSDLLEVYYKYNNTEEECINFTCIKEDDKIKHTFGELESSNLVNYIVCNNKIESVYTNITSNNLNRINEYYKDYNEKSLSYISDIKLDGNYADFLISSSNKNSLADYCCYIKYIPPLSIRIDGIKNHNKTIYEVRKERNNSSLLVAYVDKETYVLMSDAKSDIRLIPDGKYPSSISLYKSMLDKGLIEDNICWYEMEYNSNIPKQLDGLYYIGAFMFEQNIVVRDVINDEEINYAFETMIEFDIYNYNKVDTSLIYGEKMNILDFKKENEELIMKNITSREETEMIVELDGYKMIKFYESAFALPHAPIYENVYEHYLEEINCILYMKEDATYKMPYVSIYTDGSGVVLGVVLEEDSLKPLYVHGHNYYFKYDEYINLIKNIIDNVDNE